MGNNLSKLRGKHQLTLTEMAKKLGMTKQGLSFNEKVRISPKVAIKAAEILGENVFDILGSEALVIKPLTEEDKDILIKMIKEL